jgi:deferrochelatase/peroxidase EfeB
MVTEPLLDPDDIQGHVVPGYAATDLRLLAVRGDGAALRAVLRLLLDQVTSMRAAMEHRKHRKLAFLRMGPAPPDPGLRVNVALTRSGLDALGITERGVDLAFDAGMTGLSTGDPKEPRRVDGSDEPAAPPNWKVGGPRKAFDLLVILGTVSQVRERTEALAARVKHTQDLSVVYEEFGEDLPNSTEHFGFVDGISVPGLYGEIELDAGRVPVTTRYGVPPSGGLEFGKPGQPLVWPGRFIMGAPRWEGDRGETVSPVWRNGSFLVFRRLAQDVGAFYRDTDAMALELAGRLSVPWLTSEMLREMIVGRRRSGQSLLRPGLGPDSNLAINYFQYASAAPGLTLSNGERISAAIADITGKMCPRWAHIRKVNPRDGGNDLDGGSEERQLLRRGIPFGPPYDHSAPNASANAEERGLLFLAYQRSIRDQFEALNSHWMNQFEVPQGGGHDVLVGSVLDEHGRIGQRRAEWPGTATEFLTPRHWTTVTGGAYLLAPGLDALRTLVAGR